jgi:hypothetical protein
MFLHPVGPLCDLLDNTYLSIMIISCPTQTSESRVAVKTCMIQCSRTLMLEKYDAHICGLMYVHLLGSTRYVTTFENQCCVVTFLDMKNLHLNVEENMR